MKKDIDQYWNTYKNIYSFESVLKTYRHKVLLDFLNEVKPSQILEIGCGYTPMFFDYNDFDTYTIVEPGVDPFQKVFNSAKNNSKIQCINNLAEKEIKKLSEINYDCILLPGVLHEVANPNSFFQDISK